MRLLSLEMGADICYVEEIIDKKIVASKRIENRAAPLMTPCAVSHICVHHIDDLGTVDFIGKDNTLVFRTNTLDHPNVFQIGTADATLALQAAQMVINDVDAIDINMGCPKHFSVSGGMGAALLSKPQVVKEILTTLVRNLPKPVTCKIRLLDRMEDTLDLVRVIESTGVSALAVHCRTVAERPRDPAHWDRLPLIRSTLSPAIPLIANGDVFQYSDFQRVRTETGASSVMVARGAMWNPSIFRAEGALPLDEVISRYIRLAVDTDAVYQNTKVPIYCLCLWQFSCNSTDGYITVCGDGNAQGRQPPRLAGGRADCARQEHAGRLRSVRRVHSARSTAPSRGRLRQKAAHRRRGKEGGVTASSILGWITCGHSKCLQRSGVSSATAQD